MASILTSELTAVLILSCPRGNIKRENSKRYQAGNITGMELPLRGHTPRLYRGRTLNQPATSQAKAPGDIRMPAGIGNAYAFQVFNTISFSIVLGTPMILYFKHLEASATVLGIVAALPNLLNILQIPAAQFVEQVGYRAFVLRGWSVRSLFILAMAMVPLLPVKIDLPTRIALMLFFVVCVQCVTGISLCGFLPWVTHLVPEAVRGRYVSRDQMSGMLATLVTTVGAALYLGRGSSSVAYATLLFVSFLGGIISVIFLVRNARRARVETNAWDGTVPWKNAEVFAVSSADVLQRRHQYRIRRVGRVLGAIAS